MDELSPFLDLPYLLGAPETDQKQLPKTSAADDDDLDDDEFVSDGAAPPGAAARAAAAAAPPLRRRDAAALGGADERLARARVKLPRPLSELKRKRREARSSL